MKLLIAEDEKDLAEALSVFLEKICIRWIPCIMARMPTSTHRRVRMTR